MPIKCYSFRTGDRVGSDGEVGRWGQHARACESGWSIDRCPHYAMGEQGYQLRKSWRMGWADANQDKSREVARR